MNRFARFVAAGTLALVAACAHAGDRAAGQRIADAQCAACHGRDGRTPTDPAYPILAGQYADYLAVALRTYQTGERRNAIMQAIAKPLSRRDIADLAEFYASLPGPLTHRR